MKIPSWLTSENIKKVTDSLNKTIKVFEKGMKEFDKMMTSFSSGTGGSNKRQNQSNINSIVGTLGKSKNTAKIWSNKKPQKNNDTQIWSNKKPSKNRNNELLGTEKSIW